MRYKQGNLVTNKNAFNFFWDLFIFNHVEVFVNPFLKNCCSNGIFLIINESHGEKLPLTFGIVPSSFWALVDHSCFDPPPLKINNFPSEKKITKNLPMKGDNEEIGWIWPTAGAD